MSREEVAFANRAEPTVHNGERHRCIEVGTHKTDQQFHARVVLNELWYERFKVYSNCIRSSISLRTNSKGSTFFLQYNGDPFKRVTAGIEKLQEHFKLPKHTPGDSRKAIETYMQGQSTEVTEEVSRFLCHSERVRDQHYKRAPVLNSVKAMEFVGKLNTFHRTTQDPHKVPQVEELPREEQRAKYPEAQASTSSTSRPGPARPVSREHVGQPDQPKSPPVSPREMKVRRLMAGAVEAAGGHAGLIRVPTPREIVAMEKAIGKRCDHNVAVSINRSLRHARDTELARDTAERILRQATDSRRGPIDFDKLRGELPEIVEKDLSDNPCGLKLKKSAIAAQMNILIARGNTSMVVVSDEKLGNYIRDQNWPGVETRSLKDKGFAVFSTENIAKGSTVLDYHGLLLSGAEGERRMKGDDPDLTNYMMFVRDPAGKKYAVDASTECGCHASREFKRTLGRLVNHSGKNANLKPVLKEINGKHVVLFQALRDIPPDTELLFDYGVRRGEDGQDISWLAQ